MASITPKTEHAGVDALMAQLRECYGRVVYSHKIHEKAADIYLKRLHRLKITEIVLSAVTTGALLYTLFGDNRLGIVIGAALSTTVLALSVYTKDFNLGELAQKHKDSANRLWSVRESYLSLLTDIAGGDSAASQIRQRRDELQRALEYIYSSAPRTHDAAYEAARQALKVNEELTFTDAEIDVFLPSPLRKTKPQDIAE